MTCTTPKIRYYKTNSDKRFLLPESLYGPDPVRSARTLSRRANVSYVLLHMGGWVSIYQDGYQTTYYRDKED